ncbi:hypothetical protein SEA_OCTOBIEN14_64 [Gordonia phage Octobien14]|uniref:Uncharacterized protein n=1 Tax=Gordonia phage Octobien14 TaxID=2483673 RepID=A0A3G3M9N0_9CAUD|nr:hypothetical protein L3Y22_gp064 [Gordonia phage Octobien14]AYR03210.1 hypothetical protein SEA_OCTOBIEN14_64 [Gordonia phage Octobien14]
MSYQEDMLAWAVHKAKAANQWHDGREAVEVVVDTETRWSGGCETCEYSYDVTVVTVYYKAEGGWRRPVEVDLGEMTTSDVMIDFLKFCDELREAGK